MNKDINLAPEAAEAELPARREPKASTRHKVLVAIGIALCVVFGFMLICNIAIIVKGTLFPERPPAVLGVTPMVVLSGSMSGERNGHIEVGDLIFITKAKPKELNKGDVIAFMDGGMVVTHRIVDIAVSENGKYEFTTQGDANNSPDISPATEDELIGKYVLRIPKMGNVAMFAQTPIGMVLFIGVPLTVFMIYDAIRRKKYNKEESDRTSELEAEIARLRALAEEKAEPDAEEEGDLLIPEVSEEAPIVEGEEPVKEAAEQAEDEAQPEVELSGEELMSYLRKAASGSAPAEKEGEEEFAGLVREAKKDGSEG